MAIIRNHTVCAPSSGAACSATSPAESSKPCVRKLNAVCVDVIDHGRVEAPWGTHPRISFVFETDEKDEMGNPKFLTRTFNNYAFPKSALTVELKGWLARDISGDDEDWDLAQCIGIQARLKSSVAVSKAGNHYEKIESVNPAGAVHVQPSGTYERKEINW